LAVAIARATIRIERACQEVLHWARQVPDGATFAAHINRAKFSSKGMRDFVDVFRANQSNVERPGGLQIDDELEFGRLLDRKVGWLRAFEDSLNVERALASSDSGSPRDQCFCEIALFEMSLRRS